MASCMLAFRFGFSENAASTAWMVGAIIEFREYFAEHQNFFLGELIPSPERNTKTLSARNCPGGVAQFPFVLSH